MRGWERSMAWHYEIDPKRRLVTVVAEGDLTDSNLLDTSARLRDDPDFSPAYVQLVDLRSTNGMAVTVSGIADLEARSPLFSPESRRAMVVTSDFGYWMARLFELMRDGEAGQIRIFRDMDEARRWLGLL